MSGADKKDDDDGWQKLTQQELDVILDKHLEFVKGTRGGERAKLGMMDASYLDFSGRDLSRADLVGAMLCHCEMEETKLAEANLFACDLRGAVMVRANFDRADLRGACMAGANMTLASFVDCDMRDGVLLRSGERGELTQLSRNDLTAGMEKAKVRGANMSGAKVSDSVIVQTDLTDAT